MNVFSPFPIAAALILSTAPATAVRADLTVPLRGQRPAQAAPQSTFVAPSARVAAARGVQRPPTTPTRTAGAGSAPVQIGVRRRGRVPILPPAGPAFLQGPLPAQVPRPPVPVVAVALQEVPVNARLGRTLAPSTDVYRLPDPRSPWVGRLPRNQDVAIVSQWQGWFAVIMADGSQAYCPQTHVEVLPFQVLAITRTVRPPTSRNPATTIPAPPRPSAATVLPAVPGIR